MKALKKYWLPLTCAIMLVSGVFTMYLKYNRQQSGQYKTEELKPFTPIRTLYLIPHGN